jgi:hypothetical protein
MSTPIIGRATRSVEGEPGGIPRDEPHRFLNYQKTRFHCFDWGLHFETMRAPYAIVYVLGKGWTIYKHVWTSDKHRIRVGQWCCGATA